MFIFSNLLSALANVVDILLTAMYWIVIIRALISWVNPDPYNPIVQFLQKVTDPILEPIRRVFPFFSRMGVDISPIIAIMAIVFLKSFLVKTLLDLSFRLR